MKFDVDSYTTKSDSHRTNQDSIKMDQKSGIFIVADGLGGAPAGDVASKLTVDTFYSKLLSLDNLEKINASQINEFVSAAVTEIQNLITRDSKLKGMGSTLSALLLVNDRKGQSVHVGDSLILRFRNNKLEQMTRDHTFVQNLIDKGYIEKDDVEFHPLANVMYNCIGPVKDVKPDIETINIEKKDVYIVASDGLFKMVKEEELVSILSLPNKSAPDIVSEIKMIIADREFVDDFTIGLVKVC